MAHDLDGVLKRLGVHPDHPRVLALLPLVEVAWADGEVQPGEREAIVTLARTAYGLDPDGELLLESWLTHAPSRAYLDDGRDALLALVRAGDLGLEIADEDVAAGVIAHAEQVAQSAGGWFGFRAIDARERAALDAIAAAFTATHTPSTWDDLDEDDDTDPSVSGTKLPDFTLIERVLPDATAPSVVQLDTGAVLPIGARLTVGRHRDNDLALPHDARVSREHAVFEVEGDRCVVRDLGSTQGTFVGQERVVARRLFGGEIVRIGDTQLGVTGL